MSETSANKIAATAIIHPSAKLGSGIEIKDFAIVEADTEIGDGCVLNQHAIVRRYSVLKENVFIDSFAVVGSDNQDIKFDPSIRSGVIIGANTKIREGATVHRASYEGENTVVGENCLIMGNAHIAHDCILENGIIMANNALLAGHIIVKSGCILSGNTAVHQFVRIGEHAMISGNTAIVYDLPPFVMVAGRNTVKGLNIIGIRRAGYHNEDLQDLKRLYRRIMTTRGNAQALAAEVRAEGKLGHTRAGQLFLSFFEEESKRGYLRAY